LEIHGTPGGIRTPAEQLDEIEAQLREHPIMFTDIGNRNGRSSLMEDRVKDGALS
jgi:hypothetical protein